MTGSVRTAGATMLLVFAAGCSSATTAAGPATSPLDETTMATSTRNEVTVARRDFQVRYKLDGVVKDSAGIRLVSNPQLALVPAVADGEAVTAGATVGELVVAPEVAGALEARAEQSAIDRGRLAALRALEGPATVPTGGVFRMIDGHPILLSPGTDLVVPLSPIQELRYRSLRFTGVATVETVLGERQVACDAVWLVRGTPSDADDVTGATTTAALHCRLPGHVETAAGLRGVLELASEIYRDVTVVPDVYVGYDAATDGYVVHLRRDDGVEVVPIEVGVTDGVVRVVTSDLPEGVPLVLPEERG